MHKQNLIIYEYNELFNILLELEDKLSFKIIKADSASINSEILKKYENYLILSKKNIHHLENCITIEKLPCKLTSLVEKLNIKYLRNKYNQQSNIRINNFFLDLNSRTLFSNEKKLSLTEKETEIIKFLFFSNKPIKISELQFQVWGHKKILETHTVETHIYRLRKKIQSSFNENDFIRSNKLGYFIK